MSTDSIISGLVGGKKNVGPANTSTSDANIKNFKNDFVKVFFTRDKSDVLLSPPRLFINLTCSTASTVFLSGSRNTYAKFEAFSKENYNENTHILQ